MQYKFTFAVAFALVAFAAVTMANGADASAADRQALIDHRAVVALAAEKRISVAEARARLSRQIALGQKGARIEVSLAGHTGGSYLDANGDLVVATLDAEAAAAVKLNGVRAKQVDDSSARLESIMNRLNRQAAEAGVGAVQGWYVDVPSNSVVVTVTTGARDSRTNALRKLAASFGRSVRVEYRPAAQAPQAADFLVGGLEFVEPDRVHVCSVGFNTLDAFGRNVVLTAGHCVKASGTTSRNGYVIGATRTADFPTDDFGTFWNGYPNYWQPFSSVYLYNGSYASVAGQWDNPPVGASVCKSGRTTGFTCGTITALNQTVVYPEGIIYGLVRHSACVEGGDSGGANVSAGYYALGVTSGATTSGEKCLSKFGRANVSWYQPIGEALSRNGLRLLR